jgi:hypothetical protein
MAEHNQDGCTFLTYGILFYARAAIMAAPIAHIFLAMQLLCGLAKGLFNEQEFIVGTSFPDIRYLKVVERAETHFERVTLNDVLQEKDSFKAGMLFHSFVDEQREQYVVDNNLYDGIPDFRFKTQSLKFAEDELLKPYCDLIRYQAFFNTVLPAQTTYGIDEQHIRSWHTFLQGYFAGDYSGQEMIMRYFDLNEPDAWFIKRWLFSYFYAQKMEHAIACVMHDAQKKHLLLDFYLTFVQRISG